MKKIILLAFLMIASVQLLFAQNSIAKLKYEEAEEAYASNNFELTISKLKEVETLLKSTNPKLLYLQIVAHSKIIETNPFNEYALIENTRKLCTKYLKGYEKLPNNEDKYGDIYKVSEELKIYPVTSQDFDNQKKQYAFAEEENRVAEVNKIKKYDEVFMSFVYFKEYKVGLTVEETANTYPGFKKYSRATSKDGNIIQPKKDPGDGNLSWFYIKNNKTWGYKGTIISAYDSPQFTGGEKSKSDILTNFITLFNFNPTKEISEKVMREWTVNTTSYSWIKNNKKVTLEYVTQKNGLKYYYLIMVSSFDKNLTQ